MKNYQNLMNEAEHYLEDSSGCVKDELSANKDIFTIAGALLFGVALGAIAGILLAPNRGTDTCRSLGNTVKGFGTNLGKVAKESVAKVSERVKSTFKTSEPGLN